MNYKLLFLDVDGVLNKNNTVERLKSPHAPDDFPGYTGLDKRLLDLFLPWLNARDYKIVLSSTWRSEEYSRQALNDAGIHWIGMTGYGHRERRRGYDIREYLDANRCWDCYAILDDLGPYEFLPDQRRYLVQTSFVHGVTQKHLDRVDKLLGGVTADATLEA